VTTGLVNATNLATITGAAADLINATDDQLTIDTAADVALTVTDASVTAANLNTLDGFTSGVVNGTAATTISGSGGDFGMLVAAQASGRVTMSPSFNASITGAGTTVAQASAVDNVTTGTVTTADLVDTYTAIAAAATTVINPATSVTANGTGAGQSIDMSVLGRGVTIFGLGGNDTVTGTSFADVIDGGLDNDSIEGGLGADNITLGGGSDTVVLTTTSSTDTILDFAAGLGGDVLQVDISDLGLVDSDVFIGLSAAVNTNGSEEIVVLTDAHANDADAAAAVALTVTTAGLDMVIVYENTTTGKVHVIHVTDSDSGAGLTLIAVLDNLATTAGLVNGNFGGRP
jgi:Ca2+-binding RTX toxin-like protein